MQARRVSTVKADFQCNRGCVSSLYKLCTIFYCTLADLPLVGGDGMTQYFGYFACAMNFAGPLAYSILVGFLFGLFAVSVTSFGILAVSIFPNRYVGIAASFVAFYVIYAFTGSFPFSVNVWYLSSGVQVLNVNGFAVNYFYAIGIMLLFCMVPWCLCFWAMKRRKHEGWI